MYMSGHSGAGKMRCLIEMCFVPNLPCVKAERNLLRMMAGDQ